MERDFRESLRTFIAFKKKVTQEMRYAMRLGKKIFLKKKTIRDYFLCSLQPG